MNIRVIASKENKEKYIKMLKQAGFTISNDATLTFKEDDYIQDSFIGEKNGSYEIIHYQTILLIESFGHQIVLHTLSNDYTIKEKLYELESILHDKGFIRINKSTIVNKKGIKSIKPTFNGRIDLLMKNNTTLYVSKTYNKKFKEFIGF